MASCYKAFYRFSSRLSLASTHLWLELPDVSYCCCCCCCASCEHGIAPCITPSLTSFCCCCCFCASVSMASLRALPLRLYHSAAAAAASGAAASGAAAAVPGVSMASLRALPLRSVLLTSGTLSPLESFAHELQLGFRYTLENPHVIDPSQVWVGVVPAGPTGTTLNSSYANRNSDK